MTTRTLCVALAMMTLDPSQSFVVGPSRTAAQTMSRIAVIRRERTQQSLLRDLPDRYRCIRHEASKSTICRATILTRQLEEMSRNEGDDTRAAEPIPSDNDPEASFLFTKLPEDLTRVYNYVKVLGRGSFGIVVLAQQKPEALGSSAAYPGTQGSSCLNRVCASCSFLFEGSVTMAHAWVVFAGNGLIAVKIVRTVYGAESLAMREGMVQATIDSPLIPKCFDYGISKGLVYLVQEYIQGGVPLDKVLENFGPMSPQQVAQVGVQVASALQAVHDAGFVYRDVKPQNILRRGQGNSAKFHLIDYGSGTHVHALHSNVGLIRLEILRHFGPTTLAGCGTKSTITCRVSAADNDNSQLNSKPPQTHTRAESQRYGSP